MRARRLVLEAASLHRHACARARVYKSPAVLHCLEPRKDARVRPRLFAQALKPTLYCLAPSNDKQRRSVPVREVRAYGRAEVPHVHLRAAGGVDAAQVFPLAVCVHERAAIVEAWRREAEGPLRDSCVLCHGACGGTGHVCSAWVRVQVHVPAFQGSDRHAGSASPVACVHEHLAYAELSLPTTTSAGALPEPSLLLCVAGEQQVLTGMLNAVALAMCLRAPETVVPKFGIPPAGVSLLSLYACVEHYAAALQLDTGERSALHLHSTRVALNQQPALELSAPPGEVLACWRALLRHRLFHVPGEAAVATPSAHVVRAMCNAVGHAVAAGDLTELLERAERALPAWPEALFTHLREWFASEFRIWSRDMRTAPRLHDVFASTAQRQRRDLLFLQFLLHALGPPAVGTRRVPAEMLGGARATVQTQ